MPESEPNPAPAEAGTRLAARVALYGALLLTGTAGALLVPLVRDQVTVERQVWHAEDLDDPAIELLQELVRIDTTPETGDEVAAAELLAERVRALGMEPHIERLGHRKANFWAILEGKRREALVLHSHLDTDPVRQPEKWRYAPFGGVIKGPWIWGRGAFDMKSITAAQLEAFAAVRRRSLDTGEPPERSLVLLATSSEETGSHLGARWIVDQHPELTARAWALLTEGGIVEAAGGGRVKYMGIAFGQKVFATAWAYSDSRQRLEELRADLEANRSLDRRLLPEAEVFLRAYAPSREELLLRQVLENPRDAVDNIWPFQYIPPYLQALYRNEAHPFPVSERAGGGYEMRISLHLLPDVALDAATFDRTVEELLPAWMTNGVRLRIETAPAGPPSPLDHPAFVSLRDYLRRELETDAVGPYFLTFYDNDARYFRAAGVASYGFSPFVAASPDSFTVAGPNERIAIVAFLRGVDLYKGAVQTLLEAPESAAETEKK